MRLSTKKFFELVDLQARMSLKAEASRLLLSYGWWILEPILFIAVFYFVFDVLLGSKRPDYLLFLLCGKIPFMWFSKSVAIASNSIAQNKQIITQLDIPKVFFPVVSIQQSLYKEIPVFVLMIGIILASGHGPNKTWLLAIPLILVQYLMILVCSLIGSLAVARVADFRIAINMLMTFLLFVSGVFWDINQVHDFQLRKILLCLNPVAFFLNSYRQIFMHAQAIDLIHLTLLAVVLLMAAFLLIYFMFRRGRMIASWVLNS